MTDAAGPADMVVGALACTAFGAMLGIGSTLLYKKNKNEKDIDGGTLNDIDDIDESDTNSMSDANDAGDLNSMTDTDASNRTRHNRHQVMRNYVPAPTMNHASGIDRIANLAYGASPAALMVGNAMHEVYGSQGIPRNAQRGMDGFFVSSVSADVASYDTDLVQIIKAKDKAIRTNAPMALRRHFENKGFAVVQNNLSQANTKLNEFVELMRMDGLAVLNGCSDPVNCKCTFRHKRCRLFIARYESYNAKSYDSTDSEYENAFRFYSSSCKGVERIGKTDENESDNSDDMSTETEAVGIAKATNSEAPITTGDSLTKILEEEINNIISESSTNLTRLIGLFDRDFTNSCIDIIEYLHYIIGSESHNYIADVIFIADPYFEGAQHSLDNGYGKPENTCESEHTNCDGNCDTHLEDSEMTCCMDWHRDIFSDPRGMSKPYDCVALFILNGRDITPHSLMIGKAEMNIDASDKDPELEIVDINNKPAAADGLKGLLNEQEIMTKSSVSSSDGMTGSEYSTDSTQSCGSREVCGSQKTEATKGLAKPEIIETVRTIELEDKQFSDIGYVIDQRRELYHKHTQFKYGSAESRRNVVAIRFKYV